ncbi:DUF3422 family protein [Denitrobaculum tricleocarpae]|uniref:DUF3422 domain-containing protein n=1 Tax=Denitrobaculum tricleocarpae TaxID=2591009 RepID=A0A545TAX9_9PROT|nr:DUF3422 domain-containing protein [Denitrobaculum tricleocarpae]TQV74370.1 DUF3422 domain-containing protein [Denitrobaculum tricleocarpae]
MRKQEYGADESPSSSTGQTLENQTTLPGGGTAIHPLRHEVMAETNARPALPAASPCICEHLVFLSGELDAQKDWENVRRVAQQLGKTLGDEAEQQLVLENDSVIFKWERHTEFCSYTAVRRNPPGGEDSVFGRVINIDLITGSHAAAPARQDAESPGNPIQTPAIKQSGKPVVALRFYVDTPQNPRWSATGETDLLTDTRIVAVTANGGKTKIMTDFRFHADGYSRFLVQDTSGNVNRLGRVIQRLIDIETYRTLALITWPLAKSAGQDIGHIDGELRRLIQEIGSEGSDGPEDQARLLSELTALAARAETVGAETNFRFSAAKAYYSIVTSRLGELREERIEGYQRISSFIERRLGPAIRSFQAILDRQNSTSERIARASSLLRTRVDVELERQNQDLLASMDRRSQLQLRLQQTVEGLSVAAVSYYCIGILSWLLKGIPKAFMPIDPAVITTVAAPFIILSIWLMVRRIRKSAHDSGKKS